MAEIWIGLELHSLNNLIQRYFEFSSHKRGIGTVTGNNGWIIGYLAENAEADKDIYQKDIEDHFTITRATTSKVLSLMERKGLIQRQPVSHDARLKKIVLTEKARKIEGLIKRDDAERMEHVLIDSFTDEEVNTLYSYIQKMKENLSNVKPPLS
ncbi:MAG: MarR family transcriptional regulator [Clostridiaceae bacterium]|nr:MarR family transcriptional regulator [Clostridiaceae bacterium]